MRKPSIRRLVATAAAGALTLPLAACGSGGTAAGGGGDTSPKDMRFVNVVKLVGVGWFQRMEQGVQTFDKKSPVTVSQTGAETASPEKQVSIIQDLIAKQPTAITVVPNSPESLEGVLSRAQQNGITVVSHEASNLQSTDVDIEPFDNYKYGAHMMNNLASCMDGSGKYVHFVGNLTARTHMQWTEGALQRVNEKYSDVTRVREPVESDEDAQVAYRKAKQILSQNSDIAGLLGSASTDIAGIARAVQELGLEDETCVMGTSIPSVSGKYLDSGAVDKMFFWDPAVAGRAMLKLAQHLAEGKEVQEGMDLGLKGYRSLERIPDTPQAYHGNAWVTVDASNVDEYDF